MSIPELNKKNKSYNIILAAIVGAKKKLFRGLFGLLIRRRVFLETFRTKCPSSLEESSEEMSPAENSPALLARRAAQFVELSVTDGTGYRYDSYWQRVHLGILHPKTYLHKLSQRTPRHPTSLANWFRRDHRPLWMRPWDFVRRRI